MKVRLRVVSAEIYDRAKADGVSARKHETTLPWTVASETSVVGQRIHIRGIEYFVLDQYPARKAANAARKKMTPLEYRKWAAGL